MFHPSKVQDNWVTTYQDAYRPHPLPNKKWRPGLPQEREAVIGKVSKEYFQVPACGQVKIPESLLDGIRNAINTPPAKPPKCPPKIKPKEFVAEISSKEILEVKYRSSHTEPRIQAWKLSEDDSCCICPVHTIPVCKTAGPPEEDKGKGSTCPLRNKQQAGQTSLPTQEDQGSTCPVPKQPSWNPSAPGQFQSSAQPVINVLAWKTSPASAEGSYCCACPVRKQTELAMHVPGC